MQETSDRLAGLAEILRQGRWIDLSLPISEKYPRYPSQMPFQHKIANWFHETGLRHRHWYRYVDADRADFDLALKSARSASAAALKISHASFFFPSRT